MKEGTVRGEARLRRLLRGGCLFAGIVILCTVMLPGFRQLLRDPRHGN